jgi:hypothetical protein
VTKVFVDLFVVFFMANTVIVQWRWRIHYPFKVLINYTNVFSISFTSIALIIIQSIDIVNTSHSKKLFQPRKIGTAITNPYFKPFLTAFTFWNTPQSKLWRLIFQGLEVICELHVCCCPHLTTTQNTIKPSYLTLKLYQ